MMVEQLFCTECADWVIQISHFTCPSSLRATFALTSFHCSYVTIIGGACGTQTHDPLRARQVLYSSELMPLGGCSGILTHFGNYSDLKIFECLTIQSYIRLVPTAGLEPTTSPLIRGELTNCSMSKTTTILLRNYYLLLNITFR
jgi:hypothetical protein